jgi:hypothetical protein
LKCDSGQSDHTQRTDYGPDCGPGHFNLCCPKHWLHFLVGHLKADLVPLSPCLTSGCVGLRLFPDHRSVFGCHIFSAAPDRTALWAVRVDQHHSTYRVQHTVRSGCDPLPLFCPYPVCQHNKPTPVPCLCAPRKSTKMSRHDDSLFGHVRSRLRQSRSSLMLTTSTQNQPSFTDWNNVPAAFRPVETTGARVIDGYYLNRPLPGPPPRPRTTSPLPTQHPRQSLDMGNMKVPTPRTHRTRSAEIAQSRWAGVEERDVELRNKRASVNIAIALPPDHLDPPPPYSRHAQPSSAQLGPRLSPQPPRPHAEYEIKPYDPNDYVRPQSQELRRSPETVPTIAAPMPPTPVSPLNAVDYQYLSMRYPGSSDNNVTIDTLLTHPMLNHR